MKKYYLILFTILGALLIIFGYKFFKGENNSAEAMVDDCYKNCLSAASSGLNIMCHRDKCYIEAAEKLKNPKICEKITDQDDKDVCFSSTGEIVEDLSICRKIISEEWRSACFFRIGLKKHDPLICGEIPDWIRRESCYEDAKLDNKDPEFCENKISNSKNDKDLCFYKIATKRKDSLICLKISTNNNDHAYTKDECLKNIAKENKNPLVCGNIENQAEKFYCYRDMTTTSKMSPEFCANEITGDYDKDVCYELIAIERKDTSLCRFIIDKQRRSNCRSYSSQ